ncbi:MAG TPA: NAD(P)H-dependent oxidoreductase subunit E [Acidimicrobiales bacterium]|jgi:NADH-quinone oxidoreductase subunit E|nr:NAD(P)H-dependent oxidoreductase subunit E [Acidimicrobiales bacterium]
MSRLTKDNVERARLTISLYPQKRSAMIPLLHLVQEQNGYLTKEGIEHVAELLDLTAAEVYGTASFYDMFFTHPVGKYLVSVCTNIACMLNGGYELLEHAEEKLGCSSGGSTPDGMFTLEEVECIGLCANAPCLTVNWRFFGDVTNDDFDSLADDLRAGRLDDTIPPHGTLSRVRRTFGLKVGAGGPSAPGPVVGAEGAEAGREAAKPAGDQPDSARDVRRAAKDVQQVKEKGDTASERGTGERQ